MSSVEIDLTGDDEVPMLKMAKTSNPSSTTLGRMISSGGMNSGGMQSGGKHSGGMHSGGMGKN